MYHSHLSDAILEVRELVKDGSHFAFLQQRAPVTIHSTPEAHVLGTRNMVEWEFVAGSAAELATEDGETVPRLEALKSLQEDLETQGVLGCIWRNWDGSRVLTTDRN